MADMRMVRDDSTGELREESFAEQTGRVQEEAARVTARTPEPILRHGWRFRFRDPAQTRGALPEIEALEWVTYRVVGAGAGSRQTQRHGWRCSYVPATPQNPFALLDRPNSEVETGTIYPTRQDALVSGRIRLRADAGRVRREATVLGMGLADLFRLPEPG